MLPRLRVFVGFVAIVGAASACAALVNIGAPPPIFEDGGGVAVAGVTISPGSIDVAEVACPDMDRPVTSTNRGTAVITNKGSETVHYALEVASNATFTLVSPASGELAAGASTEAAVEAKATLPGRQTADLRVTVGGAVRLVPIRVNVNGGLLRATPSFLDMGELRVGDPLPAFPIEFRNDGNATISLEGFEGNADFKFGSTASVTLEAGRSASVAVSMKPTGTVSVVAPLDTTLKIHGSLCGAAPKLNVAAARVGTDVVVSPLSADFGDTSCGVAPRLEADVIIGNYSSTNAVTYTAKLVQADSRFSVVSGATGDVGTILPDGPPVTKAIHVKANPNTVLGELTEDLQIDFSAPPGTPSKTVKLRVGVYGAVLESSAPSLGPIPLGETMTFTLKNTGNARTCVTYGTVSNDFDAGPVDILNAQASDFLGVAFGGADAATSSISLSHVDCEGGSGPLLNAPLCPPLPTLSVSGAR